MNDHLTKVSELRQLVKTFVDERDWQQFHAPKNVSMALAIEAAELMELFQWMPVEESRTIADNPDKFQMVKEELADVICYALAMANELNIDVTEAMMAKMVKNRKKYPAEEFRSKYE